MRLINIGIEMFDGEIFFEYGTNPYDVSKKEIKVTHWQPLPHAPVTKYRDWET